MPHRVNILLDNPSWSFLQTVAKGKRSQIVNLALADWATKQKRTAAAKKMDDLRVQLAGVPTAELVSQPREDLDGSR